MSTIDFKFYEQAAYLIDKGYHKGSLTVDDLALALSKKSKAERIKKNKLARMGPENDDYKRKEEPVEEDEQVDGVSYKVLDSRP